MFDLTTQLLVGLAALLVFNFLLRRRDLDHIPTVGYSNPLLSVISSVKYIFSGRDIILEGYRRYPTSVFKFQSFDGWTVVLNGTQHIDDIRRASAEQVSAGTRAANYFQYRYTLGQRLLDNPFHVDVVRAAMTKNLNVRYQDIHDEVVRAYSQAIGSDKGWVALSAFDLQVDVICRVSCRYFFGQPLCDNPEFRRICERASMEIFKGRFIRLFPTFFRPFASRFVTDAHELRAKMASFLQPLIDERLEQDQVHGQDRLDRPNDLLTWLMDAARVSGEEITASDLSSRVLFITFGAIHTASSSLTAALYQLCLSPEDAQELREEVETVVKDNGWSKSALGKMFKLDSYLRESQRLHTMSILTMGRETIQDFVFSDGTMIPKNTALAVNNYSRHLDEKIYPDANIFNGFRFLQNCGESQPLVVTPTLEYHSFGHGRPSCPGRFLAVTELKSMLGHIVTNYDIKLETDKYPAKEYVEANSIANRTTKILFRKRLDEDLNRPN